MMLYLPRADELKTVSLRYLNVYAPRPDPKPEYASVIPQFFSNALVGKLLPIFGDGNQTMDFIFIVDIVEATMLTAESKIVGSLEIASGDPVSANELAVTIKILADSYSETFYGKPRKGDILHSV